MVREDLEEDYSAFSTSGIDSSILPYLLPNSCTLATVILLPVILHVCPSLEVFSRLLVLEAYHARGGVSYPLRV